MSKKLTFLLDMDGVCVDFITPALNAVGRPDLIDNWKDNQGNLGELTGLSYGDIWEKIDGLEESFWRDMKEYPWFWDMYNHLSSLGEVVFCTSPSWDENCPKGKLLWLHDRFGRDFRNYVFTNYKYLLASRRSILIDDTEAQCNSFIKGGLDNFGEKGRAILFPQPWNAHKGYTDDRLGFIKDTLNGQI